MPSTTVHLPDELLFSIDRFVQEEGISRNKFIIKACEDALKSRSKKWPPQFFASKLTEQDQQILSEGVQEMENAIVQHRKNRTGAKI